MCGVLILCIDVVLTVLCLILVCSCVFFVDVVLTVLCWYDNYHVDHVVGGAT